MSSKAKIPSRSSLPVRRDFKFNDWQIERIRSRLNAYKAGYRGKKFALKTVLIDILSSEVTANGFPEDGSEPAFKEEALRRFAKGISKRMELDKLADVRDFLIDVKYLTQEELDENPYDLEEVLNAKRYYGSTTRTTKTYLKMLAGTYIAERQYGGVTDRVTVELSHDEKNDFLHVEDHHERICDPEAEDAFYTRKDKLVSFNQKRRGYGLVCLNTDMVYMFLRGVNRDDLVSYSQIGPKEIETDRSLYYFVRNGVKYFDPDYWAAGQEGPFYYPYIFKFSQQEPSDSLSVNEGDNDG